MKEKFGSLWNRREVRIKEYVEDAKDEIIKYIDYMISKFNEKLNDIELRIQDVDKRLDKIEEDVEALL